MKTRENARRYTRRSLGLGALALACALTACSTSGSGSGSSGSGDLPSHTVFVVPFAPGGGTDTWARLMAPALSKVLPNKPTIDVENRDGGEGIPANNKFYTQTPADGSELLVGTGSSYIPYLLGQSGVEYNFSKMIPLIANGTGSVLYASKKSGITSVDDLMHHTAPMKYGAITATGSDIGALISFDLLKLNVKTTFGFEGRGPIGLAVQRGELDIDRQTSSAYNETVAPLAKKGEVVPLMSYGVMNKQGEIVRDPNFPDLPTVTEVYKKYFHKEPSGAVYDAYKTFAVAIYTYEKTLWAKPGTSQKIISAYNEGVATLKADPSFEKKRIAAMGNYPLLRGDSNEAAIRKSLSIAPDVHDYVVTLLKDKYHTSVS